MDATLRAKTGTASVVYRMWLILVQCCNRSGRGAIPYPSRRPAVLAKFVIPLEAFEARSRCRQRLPLVAQVSTSARTYRENSKSNPTFILVVSHLDTRRIVLTSLCFLVKLGCIALLPSLVLSPLYDAVCFPQPHFSRSFLLTG